MQLQRRTAWDGLYICIFTYGLFLGPQRRDVEATIDSTLFLYIGVKPARLTTILLPRAFPDVYL